MWATLESWQLGQLNRLAEIDSERVETVLNTIWTQYPRLFGELAIMAVDDEKLNVGECALLLGLDASIIEERVRLFRAQATPIKAVVSQDGGCNPVARLSEFGIAVWEVVREYRKLGSLDALRKAFPAVPEGQLATALRYAQENPLEIERLISDYENVIALQRAEFPYAS